MLGPVTLGPVVLAPVSLGLVVKLSKQTFNRVLTDILNSAGD